MDQKQNISGLKLRRVESEVEETGLSGLALEVNSRNYLQLFAFHGIVRLAINFKQSSLPCAESSAL
jgi:hypothetical protein